MGTSDPENPGGGMLISESYRQANADMHAAKPHFGSSGYKHLKRVAELMREHRCRTVLDYGCGKQTLAAAMPWARIASYDPAIPELAKPPMPADLVVCTDVLEHVEPECLEDVLDDLRKLTLKCIYLEIATSDAKKHLEDGRNAHLIVQPLEWWLPNLLTRFSVRTLDNNDLQQSGFLTVMVPLRG